MMTLVHNMPKEDRVVRILRDIFSRDVSAKKAPFAMVTGESQGTLGVFTDKMDNLVALAHMDLPLSCAAGAALSMIPPAQAKEGARTGTVPENILENLVEVYNIGRSWFDVAQDLKLARVEVLPTDLPRDLQMLLLKPAKRLDAELSVSGYGTGRYSLCVRS